MESNSPNFKRPPVSEWMSPPKSSGLSAWAPSSVAPSSARKIVYDEPAKDTSLHLDLHEDSSPGWSTPPRSKRDDHFSLQLSPQVSITLHSPRSVKAYVSSSRKDRKKRKLSLKIRSPRRKVNKSSSSEDVSDVVEELSEGALLEEEGLEKDNEDIENAESRQPIPDNEGKFFY